MHWIIETTNGNFEAERIKKAMNKMIRYYAGSGLEVPTIKYVVSYNKKGKETIICDKGVKQIEELINTEAKKIENYDKEIIF